MAKEKINLKEHEVEWSDSFAMPMTVAFDTKTEKVVLFLGGGANMQKQGIYSPVKADFPTKIPALMAAMVNGMADVVITETAKDALKSLLDSIASGEI